MDPLASWHEEQRSVFLYRACAEAEGSVLRAELFRRLAGEAEAQATIWRAQLTARGHAPPAPYRPDLRARLVVRLVRVLGPERMRNVLAAMKVRGTAVYASARARDVNEEIPVLGHGIPVLAPLEQRHGLLGRRGHLRAAVCGVNNGLVSNASLILGVAAASSDPHTILLTGVAGMSAGALAMAAGEYVSVQSQRELYDHQVALERDELRRYPEAEAQELALIYEAQGMPSKDADRLAQRLIADPAHALKTLAREELGLNRDELGSPWRAAAASFASFGAGALLPLVPYLLMTGPYALPMLVAITAGALFAVGSLLSLFTGRGAIYSGMRMLALGAVAGGVTFAIGTLIGSGIG